jgi:hypothetical protein
MTTILLEVLFEFLLAPLLMPLAMPFILIAAIFSRQGYWVTVKRYTRGTWERLKGVW